MFVSKIEWHIRRDGSFDLTFTDYISGTEETRHYKTHRGAACAETRFHNRFRNRVHRLRQEQAGIDGPTLIGCDKED